MDVATNMDRFAGMRAKVPIRIVLIESHALLREGVKRLIEADAGLHIVADVGSIDRGLAEIEMHQPDIVFTDLPAPPRTPAQAFAEIARRAPRTRIIVLTAHAAEEQVRTALNAGAEGYLLKDTDCAELLLAIRTVRLGHRFLCKPIASSFLTCYLLGVARPPEAGGAASVTPRECEVLKRIALGESNKTIARALNVSPKTVEKHRSNLMRKLQLHHTAAVTLYAIRNGLINQGDRPRPLLLGSQPVPV